jgi:hypothetical protein
MKDIWIFGHNEVMDSHPYTDKLTGVGEVFVKYFKLSRVELNEYSLEGYNRPHLIINLQEPSDEMKKRQGIAGVFNDAQIINLY